MFTIKKKRFLRVLVEDEIYINKIKNIAYAKKCLLWANGKKFKRA